MKLHEVKLSSQKPLPYLQRMFDFVKGFKPNVKLNDIARLCAKFEVEMGNINVRDEQTLLDVLYDGIPPLKDNPKEMNSVIQSFIEHYDDQDIEEAWEDVEHSAKRFFRTN